MISTHLIFKVTSILLFKFVQTLEHFCVYLLWVFPFTIGKFHIWFSSSQCCLISHFMSIPMAQQLMKRKTVGPLQCVLDVLNAYTHWTSVYRLIWRMWESPATSNLCASYELKNPCSWQGSNPKPLAFETDVLPLHRWLFRWMRVSQNSHSPSSPIQLYLTAWKIQFHSV
jgi:hypothetical protein